MIVRSEKKHDNNDASRRDDNKRIGLWHYSINLFYHSTPHWSCLSLTHSVSHGWNHFSIFANNSNALLRGFTLKFVFSNYHMGGVLYCHLPLNFSVFLFVYLCFFLPFFGSLFVNYFNPMDSLSLFTFTLLNLNVHLGRTRLHFYPLKYMIK